MWTWVAESPVEVPWSEEPVVSSFEASRFGVTMGESVDPKRPQVMVPLRGAQGRTLDLSRAAGPHGSAVFF